MRKALFLANSDWYLWNFRLPLLRVLRNRGWEIVVVSPRGPWAERLTAEGFRWIAFDFSRHGLNPLHELVTLIRLIRLYRQERPQLVHHFTIKCVLYGGVAARASRVPAVINAITGLGTVFISHSIRSRVLLPFIRSLYRAVLRGSHVIFQNPDDQAEFEKRRLVGNATVHLIRGSGVDVARFQPAATPLRFPPVIVILAARLNREKGVAEFVDAARLLRDEGLPTRFLAAGALDTGHPAAVNESTLSDWKEQSGVEFLGHREDIRELLHTAHIACLPSWGGEGVPRFLLEAMASGLPVVTTDVPGCREVVGNGDNGFLVPPRDSAALAGAIRLLINDPGLRARMGMRSRARAAREFSQELVIEQTLHVYDAALANAPG